MKKPSSSVSKGSDPLSSADVLPAVSPEVSAKSGPVASGPPAPSKPPACACGHGRSEHFHGMGRWNCGIEGCGCNDYTPAPAPSERCLKTTPADYTGHWRDWHGYDHNCKDPRMTNAPAPAPSERCWKCHGNGQDYTDPGSPCPECKGAGRTRKESLQVAPAPAPVPKCAK